MAQAIRIYFDLSAGTLEWYEGSEEVNYKYVNDFTDAGEALDEYNKCKGYPVIEFHLVTEWDNGQRTRVSVFDGGPAEKLVNGHWVAIDQGGMTASERAAYAEEQRKF